MKPKMKPVTAWAIVHREEGLCDAKGQFETFKSIFTAMRNLDGWKDFPNGSLFIEEYKIIKVRITEIREGS